MLVKIISVTTAHSDRVRSSLDSALLPLGLALGSPIFPSGCERTLGVALGSLRGSHLVMSDSLEKSLMLRKIEGRRRRG